MHKERCLLYESGELSAEEAAAFEMHLESCPGCREWLAVTRRAYGWADARAAKPPRALVSSVSARVGEIRGGGRERRFLAPLTLALSFACLAVLVVHKGRPPERFRGAAVELPRPLPPWDSSRLEADIIRTRKRLTLLERDVERAKSLSKGEQP